MWQIFTQDIVGNQPLHVAAFKGYKDVVEYLVGRGADINARDFIGNQPIDLAARMGHEAVVEYLRSKEADLDRRRERQEL